MYVIVTYDVGVKRNKKILGICRRYLEHVQKSVFEGFVTDKKMIRFQKEIQRVIVPEDDQVAIYVFDTLRYTRKEIIGYHLSTDNIV